MRISGQVIGAPPTTATRRSVILSAEGCELRLVFCTAASSVSSAQKSAPKRPPAAVRNDRRWVFMLSSFSHDILYDYIFKGEITRESRRIHCLVGAAVPGRCSEKIERPEHRNR